MAEAKDALTKAEHHAGLLLLSTAAPQLATDTDDRSKWHSSINTLFVDRFLRQDLTACLDILVQSDRIPEAALMAR